MDDDLKQQIEELKREQERLKSILEEPVKFAKRTSIAASGEFKELLRELNKEGISEEKFLRKELWRIEMIKKTLSVADSPENKIEGIKNILEE